jgi:uncharacterized membrane protein YfcA
MASPESALSDTMHSALLSLATTDIVYLALISIAAGVGISAVGPGGVLMTIGLFAFTPLSPSLVAGTAIVTHVATGLVGTLAYWRSGQFHDRRVRRIAVILCATTIVGIPIGMAVNARLSHHDFGLLLGIFSAVIGALVVYRQRHAVDEANTADAAGATPHDATTVLTGIGVGAAAALFGIGGPMLCVPLLVAAGLPMLPALAAAQAQSVMVAGSGAIGYAAQGAIDWPLAIAVAIPQMAGVVIGWTIARAVPARALALCLAFVLIALAPYLALGVE